MDSISIETPQADIDAFRAQMGRYVNELGKTRQEALKIGVIALLTSIGKATKQSPARRKVVRDEDPTVKKRDRAGSRFRIDFDKPRPGKEPVYLYYLALAQAKMDPRAKIEKQGLARASWGWALQSLYGTNPPKKVQRPHGLPVVYTGKKESETESSVTIANKLAYIRKAFGGSSQMAVDNAIRTATATMRGRVDQRLKGKFK